MWCVYFLRSKQNSDLYIGSTNNVIRRLHEHNNGQSTSTKANRPWELISYITVATEEKARELEQYFKTGSGRAIYKKRILSDEALA
jgi:predicted GIY-YIG superfamily endonuclease